MNIESDAYQNAALAEHSARQREAWGVPKEVIGVSEVIEALMRHFDAVDKLFLDPAAVDLAARVLHEAVDDHEGLWKPYDFSTWSENDIRSYQEGVFQSMAENARIEPWRTKWSREDAGILGVTWIIQSLYAFAYFGISPSGDNICTVEEIRTRIATAEAASQPENEHFNRTLLAAQARLALDEGIDVSPAQLAALARIESKSMKNAFMPSGRSGLELKDGLVTAASALNWLAAKSKYKQSIWKDIQNLSLEAARPIEGELLFVPFASDGSQFDPGTCRRDGKYTVGPKGFEQTFSDYRQALDTLARMTPAPCWKRPNAAGNWDLAIGQGFRPRSVAELGLRSEDVPLPPAPGEHHD